MNLHDANTSVTSVSSLPRNKDRSIDVTPSVLNRPGVKLRLDSSIDAISSVIIRTRS